MCPGGSGGNWFGGDLAVTARYRFLVSQSNLNVGAYGTPVSVLAGGYREAVGKALRVAGLRDGNVMLKDIEEVEKGDY